MTGSRVTKIVSAAPFRPHVSGSPLFGRRAHQGRHAERKAMIDRHHNLPIARQAKVLNISRGSVYYQPRPTSPALACWWLSRSSRSTSSPCRAEIVLWLLGTQESRSPSVADHMGLASRSGPGRSPLTPDAGSFELCAIAAGSHGRDTNACGATRLSRERRITGCEKRAELYAI
ncbi:hypothetical protein CCR94_08270 [Rhodoblastus sphagnicola]|uniref:Uncharacterized protein n=1 Tax=Rhodoblastus sphagnicola TaxID=333368 RepID=A0A2S6NAK9_9HYPH|nr:hypothetical protein CCR94_08270 [Rhodoblastus sphagnicola]